MDGIAVAPIMSIAGEDTRLAALNHHLRAVAIVFDFVNPVLALGRLIDRGSKLWLDESEAGGITRNMRRFSCFEDPIKCFEYGLGQGIGQGLGEANKP